MSNPANLRQELYEHLTKKLLPFWLERCLDHTCGGFITHFDRNGNDTGEDEKSLIAQARTVYTMSSAHREGYGEGRCAEYAKHGVDFLIEKMWDPEYGGFYWMSDRQGGVTIDAKILYGLSFAIYGLSEYTMATGDSRGIEFAEATFDLAQKYCVDSKHGGYLEMFERNWDLRGPGSKGGDRKTLDCHMHMMESLTNLYECSQKAKHRRKLLELIAILTERMLHPQYATGIPQFTPDWKVAPQIKFDIVWGWDRYSENGAKSNPMDNTSAGHNAEIIWLLLHALEILRIDSRPYDKMIMKALDHAFANGIDWEYGGVYVEGPHAGGATDKEKEFWQQVEVMIGMLDGCIRYRSEQYWKAYENVHSFLFRKGINHDLGELWPLLSREGEPIWTHMGHAWKTSYHSVRGMIQCVKRLDRLLAAGNS